MIGKRYVRAFIISIIFSIVSTFTAYSYGDSWIDGTPYFREEGKALAKALGINNRAFMAPPINVEIVPPAYDIGDKRDFLATNLKNSKQYTVESTLTAVSDTAYIFVDKDVVVDINKVNSLLESFDKIYGNLIGKFGNIPDGIDADPRIYFLVMDIVDGLAKDDSMIAGYFSPLNEFTNAELKRWNFNLQSNEAEMLYIDYLTLKGPNNMGESVIAHEFTHLIQWFLDPLEDVWVDEGTAVFMQSALGYDVSNFITSFEKEPDTSLLIWSSALANYGGAYLFFSYVSERFGGENAVEAILENSAHGTEGLEKALAGIGEPISFNKLFSDWVVANYLDDPSINDGIFGYKNLDVNVELTYVESEFPVINKKSSVIPWSAQYVGFMNQEGQPLNLDVKQTDGNDIAAQLITIGNGETAVSLVSNTGASILSDKVGKGILVISSQPDPPDSKEQASSYSYSAARIDNATAVEPANNKIPTTWGSMKR